MNLATLIDVVQPSAVQGPVVPETPVGSLHYRSGDVVPGGVFFAIPGFTVDGHAYVGDACRRGAAAVVAERPTAADVPVLEVKDTRAALAGAAAAFFGHPSRDLTLVGVTGTNGKTTVSYLLEAILGQAGFAAGVIGTVNYRWGDHRTEASRTTPEALDLQRILADMRDHGVTHVVMEVASHGIDLHRVDACWFDVAAFTNLTQDHLDFHGDMTRYWASKKALFTRILPAGPKAGRAMAVINRENPHGRELAAELAGTDRIVTFGRAMADAVRADVRQNDLTGIRAVLHTPHGSISVTSPLVGDHNRQNILAAAACGIALGLPLSAIQAGIAATKAVPGRLEAVADPGGRFIYVDYAHTPDALENVLRALNALRQRRLIAVFGCGGDRDRRKRPLMGEIAGHLSDLAVVTSDNPRTEDPMAIIEDALVGVRRASPDVCTVAEILAGGARKGHVVVPDRREAIRLAVRAAEPGDTVLIAGKGHETYQIVGRDTIPFDDREEARKALSGDSDPSGKEIA